MESKGNYAEIIIAMMRTGILGYGGGPSVIPLIRYESVTRYKWLPDEEFGETLAIANALPGPIATKMAAYLGYQQKGTLGAIVAVLAHILPSCLAMIALFSALYILRNNKIAAGMVAAVRPVIAVMLGQMAYEFAQKAWKGLGPAVGIVFGLLAFLLLTILNVHPAIVVALFLAYGSVHFKLKDRLKQRKQRKEGNAS